MKLLIGIVLIIFGIAFGLYAGLWWAFIGGIIQIIDAVKLDDVPAATLAFGIAKVLFSSAIGGFAAFCLVIPGFGFVFSSK